MTGALQRGPESTHETELREKTEIPPDVAPRLAELRRLLAEVSDLGHAGSLLAWD